MGGSRSAPPSLWLHLISRSLYSKFAVPKFPPIKLTGGTTPKACKEAMGQREGRLALGSVNRVTVAVLSHSLARGGDLLMDVV